MAAFADKLGPIIAGSIDDQCTFFTNRFVFSLGEGFSDVAKLADEFKIAVEADSSANGQSLSAAGAAHFLQAHGKTRTQLQRKAEIADIDLNQDGSICFFEYCLLHYKVMILTDYFKRRGVEPNVDLSNDGVGLSGVGDMLLEEVFDIPFGVNPTLERLMQEYNEERAALKEKTEALEAQVALGGVKGMAAKNTLEQMGKEDQSALLQMEARINAEVKKALKKAEQEVAAKGVAEAEKQAADAAASKGKLKEKASMFDKVKKRLSFKKT